MNFKKNIISKAIYSPLSILAIILVLNSFSSASGQDANEDRFPYDQKQVTDTPPINQRLFAGGSVGLVLGTITDIQLSPVVGIWALPRVAVAVGPSYRYYKDQYSRTAIYGAKAYVQFVVIHDITSVLPLGVHTGLFLHGENELLSLKTSFWKYPPYHGDRFYVNTVLAGAGLSQQIGKRSSLDFIVLWPLNDSDYELYSKPEVRISFIF
jgi:hypothetical protein